MLKGSNGELIPKLAFTGNTGYQAFKAHTNNTFTSPFTTTFNTSLATVGNDQVIQALIAACLSNPPKQFDVAYNVTVFSKPLEFFKVTPIVHGTVLQDCPAEAKAFLTSLSTLAKTVSGAAGGLSSLANIANLTSLVDSVSAVSNISNLLPFK
jgi:hypothetical protein